jgi:hypothetical protein
VGRHVKARQVGDRADVRVCERTEIADEVVRTRGGHLQGRPLRIPEIIGLAAMSFGRRHGRML